MSANFSIPNISITGIRQTLIPPGYILGRADGQGRGEAQLIPLGMLGHQLVSAGIVQKPQVMYHGLGMSAPGPFSAGQQFTCAPSPSALSMPSTSKATVASATVGPTATRVFYLVNDLPAFMASGAPHGCFASITFSTGSTTGIVSTLSTVTIAAGAVIRLVAPSPADPVLSGISIVIYGDSA